MSNTTNAPTAANPVLAIKPHKVARRTRKTIATRPLLSNAEVNQYKLLLDSIVAEAAKHRGSVHGFEIPRSLAKNFYSAEKLGNEHTGAAIASRVRSEFTERWPALMLGRMSTKPGDVYISIRADEAYNWTEVQVTAQVRKGPGAP